MLRTALISSAVLVAHVAGNDEHRYEKEDYINLFGDNLIPDANPSESYPFFDLAFCQPEELTEKKQSLGEILGGSRKVYLRNFKLQFMMDIPKTALCEKKVTAEDVDKFRDAILNDWRMTMYFDEIPLKSLIGLHDPKGGVFLWNHYHFEFSYNGDRVIEANIHTSNVQDHRMILDEGKATVVPFTYSATWKPTTVQFEDRPANNPKEIYDEEIDIQWFSIINSFILVVLLTSFLAFITIRLLKKDFQRYVFVSH